MAKSDSDHDTPERIFTLAEANELLPQLHQRFAAVRRAKTVIAGTKDEVGKASSQAASGGGTSVGCLYVKALHEISGSLQAIHELGVVIKDVDLGLCDFPYKLADRIVYLCWKFGEGEISWWHETSCGYSDRRPLDEPSA